MMKKGTKRIRSRGKGGKKYWGPEQENAILLHQDAVTTEEKNRIYQTQIHPGFRGIAAGIISAYGNRACLTAEDICCVLSQKIEGYNRDLGHKAFGYFSVIARYYAMKKSMDASKEQSILSSLDGLLGEDGDRQPDFVIIEPDDDSDRGAQRLDDLFVLCSQDARYAPVIHSLRKCIGKGIEGRKKEYELFLAQELSMDVLQVRLLLAGMRKYIRESETIGALGSQID